jgi:CubicO group peptidase (beta-lactamase class C family)
MEQVPAEVARVTAGSGFSGAIRVETGDGTGWSAAFGLASRRFGVANSPDTLFGIASGTKGLTALTVMSLVEEGALSLSRTARSVLGADLPLVGDGVTVEHLLTHRSGIGDYFGEDAGFGAEDYVLPVPVHRLGSTEAYLEVLQGHPAVFVPDERFVYCNSGYVVLALIAERVAGRPFADLVHQRVCRRAGMTATGFARGDAPPKGSAEGYVLVDGHWRTNVLHLPVLGSGDGGMYATTADFTAFWTALFAGRIVSEPTVAAMVEPRSEVPSERRRYGMGFWLHRTSQVVMLEGLDAGISFRSVHDPVSRRTLTTISNTTDGAWPVTAAVEKLYGVD